jgi:hypothetical protein
MLQYASSVAAATRDNGTRSPEYRTICCRASSGNDDCLLINAGMFHGCVAYAIDRADQTRWSSGASTTLRFLGHGASRYRRATSESS